MRVQLVFEMTKIPVAYRLGTLSIIKEMIRNGSEDYYDSLFSKAKRKMKPFSYSTFIPNLAIEGEVIRGTELHLNISSPHYEFIMFLVNGAQKERTYFIKGAEVTLKKKRLLPDVRISERNIIFKTLSPILIETKDGKPVLATDDEFKREFQYVAHLIITEVFGREPKQPIKVTQTMMTKQIMKENLHQKQSSALYLTANKGLLQLQGDPEDLQCLYDAGVSMRRSLGLGLLDVVEEVG
ncbi:CRISPR-associated endoribonuclease Cas6 [Lederbergia sp. NSJ-179]|uniref:CRISPR-associated endoribonuclease Cas6 n=1 Tax=Lederbergia sp. NSJ-179 TaxID=2931402 RepID=UPI001FD11313|nr:CRISPR-associated endoribonuclease Cas6 [Lederbergia sp. NSJ-179]MCJ7843506.1 CRISPR-associated endoribonuclease Cas6 [Lederbergia sp. NSJ-179]